MNWVSLFLRIRWLQTKRELTATGSLGMVLAAALFVGFLHWWSEKLLLSPTYLALPALALVSVHFTRSDHRFLLIHFPKQKSRILLAEYFIFSSPFWIAGFYFQPLWAGLLLPLALVLPFVPVFSLGKTRIELPIIRFIPIQFYEWRANMRENPWVWLLVFVLPLFTFFHLSFPLVAWVLELFALTGLYKQTEDWTFLHLNYTSPRNLLFQKFKTHYSLLLLANLPSVILFLVFNPDLLWIPSVFALLLAFHVFYNLVCKYAFYEPNQQVQPNQIWVGIGLLALLLPPFLPLPFFMAWRFYYRSIANLNSYFNA